jgi:hypothetical protein
MIIVEELVLHTNTLKLNRSKRSNKMDDLPVFVPAVSFSTRHLVRGDQPVTIIIEASRNDPQGALREAATEKIKEFLLRGYRGVALIIFEGGGIFRACFRVGSGAMSA